MKFNGCIYLTLHHKKKKKKKRKEGASGSVMVSKLDLQTYTSEFKSHCVSHSYGLVPHLSKKLSKLPPLVGCDTKSIFK